MKRRVSRIQTAKVKAVPAPVGGWNAKDALDAMHDDEAVSLVNFFPGNGKVSLRKGCESYATGLGATVETLAEFNAGSTRKFLAAADGEIWDISSSGAATSLASGFANNRWQTGQFDDASGGPRMGLVNGADDPQEYDGSSVSAMTISGTGLTPAEIVGINIFKNRSYFWTNNSQDFWYSATNALGGTLTKFPLGRVSGFGGNLVTMGTWTVDGGDGSDDLAVFVMSSGDVIIYAGDDPGSNWALKGIYRVGAPLGVRAILKLGADLIISTKDGYLPLSRVIGTGRLYGKKTVSDKINPQVVQDAQSYSSNFGWQIVNYPRGNMALFNVPVSASQFDQHVINTQTGAWCKFVGWNGSCFATYNDELYFGGDGVVYKADVGRSDNTAAITGDAQTAWNYLGEFNLKQFTAFRLMFQSESGSLPYSVGLGIDFGAVNTTVNTVTDPTITTLWDEALWDDSEWPSEQTTNSNWSSATGIGHNVSARIRVSSTTLGMDWFSTQYMYKSAGLI